MMSEEEQAQMQHLQQQMHQQMQQQQQQQQQQQPQQFRQMNVGMQQHPNQQQAVLQSAYQKMQYLQQQANAVGLDTAQGQNFLHQAMDLKNRLQHIAQQQSSQRHQQQQQHQKALQQLPQQAHQASQQQQAAQLMAAQVQRPQQQQVAAQQQQQQLQMMNRQMQLWKAEIDGIKLKKQQAGNSISPAELEGLNRQEADITTKFMAYKQRYQQFIQYQAQMRQQLLAQQGHPAGQQQIKVDPNLPQMMAMSQQQRGTDSPPVSRSSSRQAAASSAPTPPQNTLPLSKDSPVTRSELRMSNPAAAVPSNLQASSKPASPMAPQISSVIDVRSPSPATVPASRPTLSASNSTTGTPAVARAPHFDIDDGKRLLSKRKLSELVKQIDPEETLHPDVEEVIVRVVKTLIFSCCWRLQTSLWTQ